MKKVYCFIFALFISAASFAGGFENTLFTGIKKDKGIISNGVYLNLGLGFPSASFAGTSTSLGFQPSIEIGNQWMFYNNDQFGIGLNVSWLTFGYSTGSEEDFGEKTPNISINFLKFGPMASFAIGDEMAIDAFFNLNPTFIVSIQAEAESVSAFRGLGFTPGARFRYKKYMIGFESTFGRFKYYDLEDSNLSADVDFFNPRVLLGFKF